MGTTADKLTYLNGTKTAIKQAIIDKGVEVSDTDTFRSYAAKIGEIPTGGGSAPVDETKPILFIDYNGDVLYSYTLEEAQALTELPPINVEHEKLTFAGWNYTLAEVKAVENKLHIGAMYYPTSDRLEYKVEITSPYQRVTVPIRGTTINWGDGTEEAISSWLVHTYVEVGIYWIQTWGTYTARSSQSFVFGHGTIIECYIPFGEKSVKTRSFFNCSSLQSIVIPSSVTSIGSDAFRGCSSLQSIVIPSSVTSIGSDAFSDCYALRSAVIPESVTIINSNTFSDCSSLHSIVIPSSVTSIGSFAFYFCYALRSVVIPESVTIINNSAFSDCGSLQSIVIPSSVTSIGDGAFYSTRYLQSIICYATNPPTLQSSSIPDQTWTRIFVPDDALADYEEATNWDVLSGQFYPLSEIEL